MDPALGLLTDGLLNGKSWYGRKKEDDLQLLVCQQKASTPWHIPSTDDNIKQSFQRSCSNPV